ncbi:hypothetical protein MRB53_035202 [Persea americana]|uniref:Uncharacterized protein n=1 Tax=Persea americana TaxID=3435 RepID=A0ACC2K3Z7_PERAE|nr:hypothetical protein MRB53_035202 [Persea americana]
MDFCAGRESSGYHSKRVAPSCKSVVEGNGSLHNPSFNSGSAGLRSYELDCGHNPRKKVAAVSYESDDEDSVVEQFENESLIDKRWSDQREFIQLSLNHRSSFLTSDDRDLGWWDLSLDKRFFSMLMLFGGSRILLDGRFSLFDGSRINPIEEAALVLDTTLDNAEKLCEEDLQVGVLNWLQNSLRDEPKDSPITSSESADSSYDRSFCEDSSVFESSWTTVSTHDDSSSSQVSDFDRTGFWVSLLDLQGDDFELVSDKEQCFDAFQSDFPSPSFHIKGNFDSSFSDSGVTSPSDEKSYSVLPSEPVLESENQCIYSTCEGDLEGLNSDEPLFWPFERNSYWHPEIENGLCISPIKNSVNISSSKRFCAPRSVKLRFPERRAAPIPRRNELEGCTRRVLFRSGSTISTILGCKTSDGNSGAGGINIGPLKLGSCTQSSFGRDSSNISMKKRPLKLKENFSLIHYGKGQSFHLQRRLQCQDDLQFHEENIQNIEESMKKEIMIKHNDLKEVNQPQVDIPGGDYANFLIEGSKSDEEVPIEKLVGLNEFNGHEGIDEFDEGQFSFDGLLFEDPFTVSLSDGSSSIAGDHDPVSCNTTEF